MQDSGKKSLQEVSDRAPGMIYQYRLYPDGHHCFPFTSKGIESLFGLKPQDVINDATPIFKIIHPDDLEALEASILDSVQTMNEWKHEYRILKDSKHEQWLFGHSIPEKLTDGSVLWTGFTTDISNRKKVEEELINTTRLYAFTAKINELVIHSKNQKDVFQKACQIATNEGGFIFAWVGLLNPSDQSLNPLYWSGYINDSQALDFNIIGSGKIPTKDDFFDKHIVINNSIQNNKFNLGSSISLPIKFKGDLFASFNLFSAKVDSFTKPEIQLLEKITDILSYSLDSIENELRHHQSEELIKESERNFRLIFDQAPLGIAIIDSLSGVFVKVNPQYLKILGRTEEEIRHIDWMKVTHPDDIDPGKEKMKLLVSEKVKGFKMSKRYFRPDGSLVWCELSVVPFDKNKDGTPRHMALIEDVTKRKYAEEKLKKSEEMFSAITNLSPDIISILDKNGKLVYNSSATHRIHGYHNGDLIGLFTADLVHPDDRFHFLKVLSDLEINPFECPVIQYRYLNRDGSYSWMEATCLNQLNNPNIGGIITISRDISERKKMEEDLKFALAIRDEFLSIASHELKTPLTSLKLQIQMLNREIKPEENLSPDLRKISKSLTLSKKQIDRISELVENLLDVSRIQAGKLMYKFEHINLSEALEDYLERFQGQFAEAHCSPDVQIEKNIWGTFDKGRIEQVFDNLISNALKYAPGKPIEISLKKRDHHVLLIFKDHGPGIAPENQQIIFQRFERGSSPRNISGLGLGLYITKQIIEDHQGSIRLESDLGKGAAFYVELPITIA